MIWDDISEGAFNNRPTLIFTKPIPDNGNIEGKFSKYNHKRDNYKQLGI